MEAGRAVLTDGCRSADLSRPGTLAVVHPIEYLRYVARSGDASAEWLVPEAAEALRGLIDDHQTLVMGCRKLLEHHAQCGPMWWLCGHLLAARDARAAVDDLLETFLDDPTPLQLSLALADVDVAGPTTPLIVQAALAAAPGVVVADTGRVGSTTTVIDRGSRPIWVVAGVGTLVPGEIFTAVTDGEPSGRHRAVAVLGVDSIARVIRPDGPHGVEALRCGPDVPFIPELLARG